MQAAHLSAPWQFSPLVFPVCLSTREASSRTPSFCAGMRTRNSGDAEMMMSSGRCCARYHAFTRGKFFAQNASSSASTSGTRRRKPYIRSLKAVLLILPSQ